MSRAAMRGATTRRSTSFAGPRLTHKTFGLELVDEADEIAGAPPLPPDDPLRRCYVAEAAGADDGDAEMCLRRRLDAGPSTAKSIEGDADCAGPASGQRRRRSRMLTDPPGYCFSIAPARSCGATCARSSTRRTTPQTAPGLLLALRVAAKT